MFEEVKKILSEEVGIDASQITPESTLRGDLGIDSISFLNAVLIFEEKFNITMDEDELRTLNTVNDLVNYISNLAK